MQRAARLLSPGPRERLRAGMLSGAAFGAAAAAALAFTLVLGDRAPAIAVATGFASALALWLGSSERYTLTLGVLLVYLGIADGYLKLRFNSSAFLLIRDALLYAIVAGALIRLVVERREITLPPLTGWVLAWVIVVLVELLNPANGTLSHSLQALRPHLEFVPLFFLGFAVMRTPERLRGFLLLLVLVAAVNGVVSTLQFNLTPAQLAGWGPGYANLINGVGISARTFVDSTTTTRVRPPGLGSDFGFGGVVCLLACAPVIALLYRRRGTALLAAMPLLAVITLGIVTSQARVVVIGAILSILAFFILTTSSRRWLDILAATAVTAAVVFLVVGQLTGSAQQGTFDRYNSIAPNQLLATTYDYRKDTFSSIGDYAVGLPFGAGLGVVGPGASPAGGNGRQLNGESEFTFLLVETGIPGLIAIVGFNLVLLRAVLRHLRRMPDRDTQILLAALAAPLIALMLTWIVGASTAGSPGSPFMWFTAGILVFWAHPDLRSHASCG